MIANANRVTYALLFMGVLLLSCHNSKQPRGHASPSRLTLFAEGKQQFISVEKNRKENTVCTIKIWYIAPDKFRHEEHFVDHVNVRVLNGMDAWLFGSQARTAYSWRKPSVGFKGWDDMRKDLTGGSKEWVLSGAKKLGQDKISGLICDVYQRKVREGTLKGWFPKDGVPIPRRLELVGRPAVLPRVTSFRVVVDLAKREPGLQIDETWFRPPVSYHIKQAPQLKSGALPLENLNP